MNRLFERIHDGTGLTHSHSMTRVLEDWLPAFQDTCLRIDRLNPAVKADAGSGAKTDKHDRHVADLKRQIANLKSKGRGGPGARGAGSRFSGDKLPNGTYDTPNGQERLAGGNPRGTRCTRAQCQLNKELECCFSHAHL